MLPGTDDVTRTDQRRSTDDQSVRNSPYHICHRRHALGPARCPTSVGLPGRHSPSSVSYSSLKSSTLRHNPLADLQHHRRRYSLVCPFVYHGQRCTLARSSETQQSPRILEKTCRSFASSHNHMVSHLFCLARLFLGRSNIPRNRPSRPGRRAPVLSSLFSIYYRRPLHGYSVARCIAPSLRFLTNTPTHFHSGCSGYRSYVVRFCVRYSR